MELRWWHAPHSREGTRPQICPPAKGLQLLHPTLKAETYWERQSVPHCTSLLNLDLEWVFNLWEQFHLLCFLITFFFLIFSTNYFLYFHTSWLFFPRDERDKAKMRNSNYLSPSALLIVQAADDKQAGLLPNVWFSSKCWSLEGSVTSPPSFFTSMKSCELH